MPGIKTLYTALQEDDPLSFEKMARITKDAAKLVHTSGLCPACGDTYTEDHKC